MNKSVLTLFLAVALVSAAALGADTTWTHVDPNDVWTGEWSTAGYWDNGVPEVGDDAYLTNTLNSYVVNMNNVTTNFGYLVLSNAVGKTVTLNLNANVGTDSKWAHLNMYQGSVVNVNGTYRLGLSPDGHMRGGKIVVNNGGYLYLNSSNKAGGQQNLWLGPGAEIVVEEGGILYWHWLPYVPCGGDLQTTVRGLFKMDGGNASILLGWGTGHETEFRVEGNGVMQAGNVASLISVGVAHSGGHGNGLFTLADNGTVTNKGILLVARSADAASHLTGKGVVNVEGGQWYNDGRVEISGWNVNQSGYGPIDTKAATFIARLNGTLNQTDGLFRALTNVYVANGPSTGLLNLEGGQFYVTNLTGDATLYLGSTISADNSLTSNGVATLRLNGGYLRADQIIGKQGEDKSNIDFWGGTLETASTDLDLGKTLVIGDGMQAAMLNLLGGTHTFADDVTVNGSATLKGTGTITAPNLIIDSDGILAPGSSPGTLSLNGDLELMSGGIFEVEIGGQDPGEYDVLQILNGTADLSGELRVKFVNGYEDDVSFMDTFEVLTTSDGITGNFSNVSGNRVGVYGNPGSFEVDVSDGSVRLFNYVIPEPASTTMLLLGGLALMLRRRLRARSR